MADEQSTRDYRPYPKGPNFLGIVIWSGITILVIVAVTLLILHLTGRQIFPMKTKPVPSQTMLRSIPILRPASRSTQPSAVAAA